MPLTLLPPDQHERLRPLFAGFGSRLHGCIEAALSGDFGEAWADDAAAPTVALAHLDFWFVAGDATSSFAGDALAMVPEGRMIVTDGGAWDAVVRAALGERLREHERVGFGTPAASAWDRAALYVMAAALPEGFATRRVTAENVAAFEELEPDLIRNFGTTDRFLRHGLGFGVWHGERCVAGCSSYTLANRKLEIEIDTHPDFRRRGLARAVAAALVLHCIDAGIEPCWDAHNLESAALATQLGFVDPGPYAVFIRE